MRSTVGLTVVAVIGAGWLGCNNSPARVEHRSADAPVVGAQPVQAPKPASPVARPGSDGTPSLAPLVESVKSAVVNVEVVARVSGRGAPEGEGLEPFFAPAPRQPQLRQGAGSGFLIDARGRVLTNNHVVEGATTIRVKLEDGRVFEAKVLGRDPLTDVALVQLQGVQGSLPFVELGDSDGARVGDWVVAIGNPFGLASSVSAGIVSAKARDIRAGPYDDFLQTDAAINPGNSGGPLFDLSGKVIGINTAIVGGGSGIGFALPSNMARALLPQLEHGEVRRGWLGVAVQDLTPELARALGIEGRTGAVVADVTEGTPAQRAGLKPDDVIVELDGRPLSNAHALTRGVAFLQPGQDVALTVLRGQEQERIKVRLGERPDLEGLGTREPAQGDEGPSGGGRLGLGLQDVPPQMGGGDGALIVNVVPGSSADRAGLVPGMVVVEAAGKPIHAARELSSALRGKPSGSVVLVRVQLQGSRGLRALTVP